MALGILFGQNSPDCIEHFIRNEFDDCIIQYSVFVIVFYLK